MNVPRGSFYIFFILGLFWKGIYKIIKKTISYHFSDGSSGIPPCNEKYTMYNTMNKNEYNE